MFVLVSGNRNANNNNNGITSNGHANGIVEEFPSLEELSIADTSGSFPSSLESLSGFPPLPDSPPPGYMSEEGDGADSQDIVGKLPTKENLEFG